MFAKKWIVSGTCALLVMGSGVFAEEDTRPPRAEIQRPDRGGEGALRGPRHEGGHRPPPFENILERHDTNKDGKLQRTEAPERMPEGVFDRLDANGDGAIDAAESKKAQAMRQGRRPGGRDGRRGPGGRDRDVAGSRKDGISKPGAGLEQPRGNRNGRRPSAVDMFEKMDANGDGVVTREEAESLDRKRMEHHKAGGERVKPDSSEGVRRPRREGRVERP